MPVCHLSHLQVGCRRVSPGRLSSRWRRAENGGWAALSIRCWVRGMPLIESTSLQPIRDGGS